MQKKCKKTVWIFCLFKVHGKSKKEKEENLKGIKWKQKNIEKEQKNVI